MAKYRKVDPRIWNDEKFRSMSDAAQLVFLFVMTHPHQTSLGAFRAAIDGLAAEKKMEAKAFRKAFQEASGKGMIRIDEEASFVWLPNFLKYNPPESPNVVKSWSDSLDLIPECPLKAVMLQRVKDFMQGFSKGFSDALPEAFAKSMPNQEQEQEQEQDIGAPSALPPKSPRGTSLRSDWQLPDDWKAWAEKERPDLDAAQVADSFRDFWIAKPGKDGRKADWLATWRNWVRNQRSPPMHAPKPEQSMGRFV